MGFPTRSDKNRAAQSLNIARNLKFRISVEEVLYYPCSENKDVDQLHGYREADLRLCFRICEIPFLLRRDSLNKTIIDDESTKISQTCSYVPFQLWQCGGKMVDAPCSRIGHIYRKFAPFPNPGVGDFVGRVSILMTYPK